MWNLVKFRQSQNSLCNFFLSFVVEARTRIVLSSLLSVLENLIHPQKTVCFSKLIVSMEKYPSLYMYCAPKEAIFKTSHKKLLVQKTVTSLVIIIRNTFFLTSVFIRCFRARSSSLEFSICAVEIPSDLLSWLSDKAEPTIHQRPCEWKAITKEYYRWLRILTWSFVYLAHIVFIWLGLPITNKSWQSFCW